MLRKETVKKQQWGIGGYIEVDKTIYHASDVDKLKDKCRYLKTKKMTAPGKVFFHKSATFPRDKFRETFPESTIVRKIENADYIVINPAKIRSRLPSWPSPYSLNENNEWKYDYKSNIRFYEQSEFLEKTDELIDNMDDKVLLLDSDLSEKIKRNTDVTENLHKNINKLLTSGNRDDINLATIMITDLDYSNYSYDIAIIMNNHWNTIRGYGFGQRVALQALISQLDRDFPSWSNTNSMSFNLQCLEKGVVKDSITELIHQQLSRYHELSNGKKYKVIIENVEI